LDQESLTLPGKIEEVLQEDSIPPQVPQVDTTRQRLDAYHQMVICFYNPVTNGAPMLKVDVNNIHNPQYVGEFAHSN
jgi:hypothetical protein